MPPVGYPQQQQQQQFMDPVALHAQREGVAAQGVALRNECEGYATDRMTLAHQAKLLKMQEKQKKKEGKKLSKKEKDLEKREMRALKMEAERKVLAGEVLTPEEHRALALHVSGDTDDISHEKKNKKKSDKRVREIRKELMEIEFKIEKLMMEKQQHQHELSTLQGGQSPLNNGQLPPQPHIVGGAPPAPLGAGVPSAI